jgi:hypothetical protein
MKLLQRRHCNPNADGLRLPCSNGLSFLLRRVLRGVRYRRFVSPAAIGCVKDLLARLL